ncbi:MAG: RNA polymerase sigma factor [Candidatus Latescibacterota bacterium]|nr:MAG: RNA polymerase sigma factor [Candidatus Latescibacterota bacterium]
MSAVRDGDLDKLGYLFEKYHKQLYNYFLRQLGDPQSSEDIVQEVFLKMLKYRHTYRGEGRFTTWMYSIAHNARIDHFKKTSRYVATDEIDRLLSTAPSPEEAFEKSSRHEALYKALSRLSDDKREVLVLSRFQNLKYEEISRILGCPVGTIKARVFHALNDLRRFLYKSGGEVTR